MTNRSIWAKLFCENERAKQKFYPGNRLSSVSRFADELSEMPHESWSIVVDFMCPDPHEAFYWGKVRFLVDNAPTDKLVPGTELYLLDANVPVVRIYVVGVGMENPCK